nr:phage integrase N-terminal SAM-like domain-containing protein [uncultured Eisenbergiella sp.]
MDDYLKHFREMISLRGLTDHTVISYSTYIRAYLDYLDSVLHKLPESVSWQELRDYVLWLKNSRGLSDRTINSVISQLRFFTIYVLHKPWDPSQLPMRRFDSFPMSLPKMKSVILSLLSPT